jgi:hypothetical protein
VRTWPARVLTDYGDAAYVCTKLLNSEGETWGITKLQSLTDTSHTHQDGYYKKKMDKCWWRDGETGSLAHCWRECKIVQLYGKQYGSPSRKLNRELLYDLEILLLSIFESRIFLFIYLFI